MILAGQDSALTVQRSLQPFGALSAIIFGFAEGICNMPSKDGLDSAIDFTKLLITLDSALIAFATGTSFIATLPHLWQRLTLLAALFLLVISLSAGAFVLMRAATMLAEKNYNLQDKHLGLPGMTNVVCFAGGAVAICILAAFSIFGDQSKAAAPSHSLCVFCVFPK